MRSIGIVTAAAIMLGFIITMVLMMVALLMFFLLDFTLSRYIGREPAASARA